MTAIESPQNNFWTRELLSQPIARLAGTDALEILLEADRQGLEEGHDNDGLHGALIQIAERDPQACREKLEALLNRKDFDHQESAEWLLEFCQA